MLVFIRAVDLPKSTDRVGGCVWGGGEADG